MSKRISAFSLIVPLHISRAKILRVKTSILIYIYLTDPSAPTDFIVLSFLLIFTNLNGDIIDEAPEIECCPLLGDEVYLGEIFNVFGDK
jgi:hypothetical protein